MPDRATPNLPARDFSATAAFYARLGFGESYRDPGWMILTRGDLMLDAPSEVDERQLRELHIRIAQPPAPTPKIKD